MTAVPEPTFGPTGFIVPAEPDIFAAVTADINEAFGGGLNPDMTTPQGQLAVTLSAIIGNKNEQFVLLTNNVDPAFASGRMQDGIARIYFLERTPAESTVVQADCAGLTGTVIPVGALAQATDGELYACTQAGTIPLAGTVTLPFACVTTGPIACPAATLNVVYRALPGWDSINNPADGVIGNDTESRQAFEERRFASVALNSIGQLGAIRAAVLNVANVLDAYVTENPTGSPAVIGGVTVPAHCLFVGVAGGLSTDIAKAIWTKKPPGCDMYGSTVVTVTDNNSGYSLPYPTYTIKYQIAANLPIVFSVKIFASTAVPANAAALIQAALIAAFNGEDGGPRAKIGSTLFASRFYSTIAALGSWAQIISVLIGSRNNADAQFTGALAGTTLTVSAVSAGALAIGQTVQGPGVLPGTTVVSLGTGSGGTGTYNLSKTQTLGSSAMASFTPTRNDLTAQIDQIPTLDATDITVVTASS